MFSGLLASQFGAFFFLLLKSFSWPSFTPINSRTTKSYQMKFCTFLGKYVKNNPTKWLFSIKHSIGVTIFQSGRPILGRLIHFLGHFYYRKCILPKQTPQKCCNHSSKNSPILSFCKLNPQYSRCRSPLEGDKRLFWGPTISKISIS